MFPEKQNHQSGLQGIGSLLNILSGVEKGSLQELFAVVVTGVEMGDYVARKMEQVSKDQRFDDNLAKLVSQATRLYETGRISKAQFKAIIDQLPETVEAQVKPVNDSQNQINEMLKNVDPAKLAQLLEMLK